jgi:hypothetical protein
MGVEIGNYCVVLIGVHLRLRPQPMSAALQGYGIPLE